MSAKSLRSPLADLAFRSNLILSVRDKLKIISWRNAGGPNPPPNAVKRRIISSYASLLGAETFIETGTLYGDMDYAMKDRFKHIYSIELNEDLWRRAVHRFRHYGHIQILHGDSGEVLPRILRQVSTKCLFWLDGHYSGGITAKGLTETPIMQEIQAILQHPIKGHVLLIDDARCFDGTQDYPTLRELKDFIALHAPEYMFSTANDVIRIHPSTSVQPDF